MKIAFFGLTEQDKKDYFKETFIDHELTFIDEVINEENLPNENNFEVISIFVNSKITPKVIDHFSNLKMIAVRATGFDNVDLNYAKEKNIIVSNVPAYGSHTVAEFTFGLILSLSRKIPEAIEKLRKQVKFDHEGLRGFDLYGKTLGVLGTGKIGANVIKIAKAFGMNILAYDAFPNDELAKTLEFPYVSLENLLKQSDIVTVHVPSTKETFHLINKNNIYQMKRGSILINTARGDIVETEAIYDAITSGHLSGIGVDVIESETELSENSSKNQSNPETSKNLMEAEYLIKNPHVIITPHTAFYTIEAEHAIMQTTAENIQGFINNSPINKVS